jgi:hypothetical protein
MIKPHVHSKGWTLCIGAGTSLPIFPTWAELVRSLISDVHANISPNAVDEIFATFDADTLIQAACNLKNNDTFADWLSEKLYANLRSKILPNQWKPFCKIFTAVNANLYKDEDWRVFITIREQLFRQTTAYELARLITDCQERTYRPSAILSFNAEPLLYALINSFSREKALGPKSVGCCPELVNLMTLSIASQSKHRIPYYFCHGALLNWIAIKEDIRFQADSKLVFSENQYLQMSNNAFSWQSMTFLHACTNTVIIFVGVSLSDPNMRKWLSWVQSERSGDIGKNVDSTRHLGITKKPKNLETMDWMEASVSHLGVRIIWINEWCEVASVIKKIIGA